MVKYQIEKLDVGNEFGEVLNTIDLMESEHQAEGERFEKISLISEYPWKRRMA